VYSKWVRGASPIRRCGDGRQLCRRARNHHECAFDWMAGEPRRVHICVHLVPRDGKACAGSSTAPLQSVDGRGYDVHVNVRISWIESLSNSSQGRNESDVVART
jgi:hypothetical protein